MAVEGTVAGRAYQLGETLPGGEGGRQVLWVPMLDTQSSARHCCELWIQRPTGRRAAWLVDRMPPV